MAWNESGNSPRKRNPWEKRPGKRASSNQSGLDELFKHIKKIFSPISGNGGASAGAGLGLIILIVLTLFWISTGMYQVNQAQVAVITRFGKFQRVEQAGRGMHLPWPIEEAQLINIADDEHKEQLRILTRDETFVDVVYAIRFRRADVVAYTFNVRDPDFMLDELVQSSLREVFAHETLATALSASRPNMANRARELIQAVLDGCKSGIVINGMDVVDVRVPAEVKSAQDEISKAQTATTASIARAHEYASDIVPTAHGAATVLHEEAEGYKAARIATATGETEQFLKLLPEYQHAPAVTRERLYLETMESIYANARKVFVDTKGSTINVSLEKSATHSDHDVADTAPAATNNATTTTGSRGNH